MLYLLSRLPSLSREKEARQRSTSMGEDRKERVDRHILQLLFLTAIRGPQPATPLHSLEACH